MSGGRSQAKLSVNVNKVATLRNSRGGSVPSVVEATRVCVAAGSPGITVHPRADARHIRFDTKLGDASPPCDRNVDVVSDLRHARRDRALLKATVVGI